MAKPAMVQLVATAPELTVIREMLRGALSPETVTNAIFAAFERYGGEPVTPAQWSQFVDTALEAELATRLKPADVADVLSLIRGIISPNAPLNPSAPPTGRFVIPQGAARILIVARRGMLGWLLKTEMGGGVEAIVLKDLADAEELISNFQPTQIIVDQTDPLDASESEVARGLQTVAPEVLRVIWCTNPDKCLKLSELLEKQGRATILSNEFGTEPLLDVVRAGQKP